MAAMRLVLMIVCCGRLEPCFTPAGACTNRHYSNRNAIGFYYAQSQCI